MQARPEAAIEAAPAFAFHQAPRPIVVAAWPQIAAMLARSCARTGGRYTPETLLEQYAAGEVQLWIGYGPDFVLRAVGVTTLSRFPSGMLVAEVLLGSGRKLGKAALRGFMAAIEDWARANGAERLVVTGRQGWARLLDGFAPVAVVSERAL